MTALTAAQGAAVAGFEIIKKNAAAGDGVIDTIHKIRVWDKLKALELLAKRLALLTAVVRVQGPVVLKWIA